jgi:hypothetical protein
VNEEEVSRFSISRTWVDTQKQKEEKKGGGTRRNEQIGNDSNNRQCINKDKREGMKLQEATEESKPSY